MVKTNFTQKLLQWVKKRPQCRTGLNSEYRKKKWGFLSQGADWVASKWKISG